MDPADIGEGRCLARGTGVKNPSRAINEMASPAKTPRTAAVSVPVMGFPWPPASTVVSSAASLAIDL
jgi:hypothetical protein